MEGYGQGASRKGLLIDPYVERFKTANLEKFSLPGKIHIVFVFVFFMTLYFL